MLRRSASLPDLVLAALLALPLHAADEDSTAVRLRDDGKSVILDNGRIMATVSKSGANVTSLRLGQHEMVSPRRPVYYSMGGGSSYRQPSGGAFRITKQAPDVVDVSFLQKWKPGSPQAVDIEVHYALKRGESGLHTYAILSHPADYPDSSVGEWRMVWGMPALNDREWLMERIRVDRLRDWEMPSPADLAKAKPTAIQEIVELTTGRRAGLFDCKYDFNLEYYSVGCWGHASDRNKVGAWIVLGSHEFFNDGPFKQDLSSASGIIHIHFGMNHYNGSSTRLTAGKEWSKIYGPFLLYGNQGADAEALWNDARAKAATERKAWPHDWLERPEIYPPRAARGTLTGTFEVEDPLKPGLAGTGSWIGLWQGPADSNWQNESNHYQYWSKVDASGRFTIPHVRTGTYHLSAVVPGAVGEFGHRDLVVRPGHNQIGPLHWRVPRLGKSLAWEIGTPDRRATEFRHGDDYFRGYLWKEFSKEFPNPLVYQIGRSRPSADWNFAQGSYLVGDRCVDWPWEIRFNLDRPPSAGSARLTLAFASSDRARIDVKVNGSTITSLDPPVSGGNALLREAIHAKYCFQHVDFPATRLKPGPNVITLRQIRNHGSSCHVMYDAVSLELP